VLRWEVIEEVIHVNAVHGYKEYRGLMNEEQEDLKEVFEKECYMEK